MDDLGRWMRRTLDEVAPPVDVRAVIASAAPRGVRVWLRAVGAGLVAAALVGGGLWLFADGQEPAVTGDATTTSLDATTTTGTYVLEILQPVRMECNVELPDYPCTNLIDGDPNTEWQAPDGGIGAVITVYFAEPVSVMELWFYNIRDDSRFIRNARIRGFDFRPNQLAGTSPGELLDENESAQRWLFDGIGIESFTITVTSAYPGQSYQEQEPFLELALAELEIVGYPGLLATEGSVSVTTVTLPEPPCSAAGMSSDLPAIAGLPDAVAAMRADIAAAAVACDIARLTELALPGAPFFYAIGGEGDPTEFWTMAEAADEQPLRLLVCLLEQPPAATPVLEEESVWYYWPTAIERPWGDLTVFDKDALRGCIGEESYGWAEAYSEYLGPRLVITDSGDWRYFVLGGD